MRDSRELTGPQETRSDPHNKQQKVTTEERPMKLTSKLAGALLAAAALGLSTAGAFAYDGTNCKAPGNCWEPKPGYPAQVKGSKYDPKHDPKELAKQGDSEREMEKRNAMRTKHFNETGEWVYDVSKISD